MKTIKIGGLEIPEKIVILNDDLKWRFLRGEILTFGVKPSDAGIDSMSRFWYERPNGEQSWFYRYELEGQIKYISSEKFVNLKAFI